MTTQRQTWKYLLVGLLGIAWLIPIYLMIVNAAKNADDFSLTSPWAPGGAFDLFRNIADAWERGKVGSSVLPTLLYAILGPAIGALVGAAAGYAIVTLRLRHGFAWFVLIFGGTVVPIQMLLMPLFVGYAQLGSYDTVWGMVLVYSSICIPFAAFVMRNFFQGIAHHVFEAAAIDGASTLRIFFQMYLPMAKPALVAVFILQSVVIWNDLILGLTLSQSPGVRPIMPSLSALQSSYGGSAIPTVLAGGLLVSIPTVLLFMCTQRVFSRGLALGQY